jgi:hypothetical protein
LKLFPAFNLFVRACSAAMTGQELGVLLASLKLQA